MKLSVLEIYKEKLRDLLIPSSTRDSKRKKLKIRELPTGENFVQNLVEDYMGSLPSCF